MIDNLTPEDRALCGRLENYTGYVGQLADIVQLTTLVRTLSRQLHEAEADAARLAEAGESCAEDLEAEVRDRWGYDERLERQLRRDMRPVVEFREALAAHTARLING